MIGYMCYKCNNPLYRCKCNKTTDTKLPVDNIVRRELGDMIKFKGTGFLGEDIIDAKIILINNNGISKKYKAKMNNGYTIFLDEDDITA